MGWKQQQKKNFRKIIEIWNEEKLSRCATLQVNVGFAEEATAPFSTSSVRYI